jgi:predicted nucleic acid-binding protein
VELRPGLIGLDADVLIHWCREGAQHHEGIRHWIAEASKICRFALTQQVLAEFLHVVTDGRRFEDPLSMPDALQVSKELWTSPDIERVTPSVDVHSRVCELMEQLRLGRKRILDTQLAVTLEMAGVDRLATLNGRDFKIFPFLEVVDPLS